MSGKILVMEWDSDDLAEYKSLLESFDYEVITAESLSEGEDMILRENPDAVLVNLDHPEDVYGFCRRYRLRGNMSILAMGDADSAAASILALKAGADDYLPKPCIPEEIVFRLQSLLRRQRNPLPFETN